MVHRRRLPDVRGIFQPVAIISHAPRSQQGELAT
jgi:hypothetical protein